MRGSYTVEAAILVPLFWLIVLIAIRAGILLYLEIKDENYIEDTAQMWEVEDFYRREWLKEIIDGEDDNL